MKKIALITGARGGIGSAITTALLAQGYRIIATHSSPNGAAAHDWYGEQGFRPDQVRLLALDVADTAMCRDTLGRLLQDEGRVDVLVNNAGVLDDALIGMVTPAQVERTFASNSFSVLYCSQYAARMMQRAGGGSIINLTSLMGCVGAAGLSVYAGSKAAVIGITQSLAKELAASQIRVNAIAPGPMELPSVRAAVPPERLEKLIEMIPVKRLGNPEFVANLVVQLASAEADFATGAAWDVNGGIFMR